MEGLSARPPYSDLAMRRAQPVDIPELVRLEADGFRTDRISARQFHHLLSKGHAVCLVLEHAGILAGYALLLFRAGTALARLYSIVVDPAWRGQGLARELLSAAEDEAREHECSHVRLEVRTDNARAIAIYRESGYHDLGEISDYYEDHTPALRMEKRLHPAHAPVNTRIPYYPQSIDFTCGPAALMMAMKALDPTMHLDRMLEFRLWREATTIFMSAGHGGSSPQGLALAAWYRGFDVDLHLSDEGPLFLDGVRDPRKKEVVELVHRGFMDEIAQSGIGMYYTRLGVADLETRHADGAVPIVLISSYRIYRKKDPHWIVLTGLDDRFIYAHDPYVDADEGGTEMDSMNVPIVKREFERMSRYGKSQLRAVIVVKKRREAPWQLQ